MTDAAIKHSVLTETHGRVGLIRFNRPEAMNALNADVVAALAAAIAIDAGW